jgi:4-hydroxybenzoate polyprenyltransferase
LKLRDLIQSLRPTQWTKNFFIFAPLVFAKEFFELDLWLKTGAAFAIFCFFSSALYLVNDLLDRVAASQAVVAGVFLAVLSLALAFVLNTNFFIVCAIYGVLQLAYSLKLKHVVILDVFIIAAGFVIRVVAGGLVIQVPLSSWLLICTTLLALFLAMSKRRHELVLLEGNAPAHRPILKEYSAYLLDQMIGVVTASTVIAYCLYTVSEETVAKFGTKNLIFTTPFVLYGIFRYLYLVHQKGKGGSPEELVITDRPLLLDIVLWIAAVMAILYTK